MIDDGGLIIIFDNMVLKLDKWIDRHPGGRLPIMHMVGKDATDVISVFVTWAKRALNRKLIPCPNAVTIRWTR
jgi:cytochrome b involved in lipid metabolism